MKMCRTCSKRAHKSVLRSIWRDWKISKSKTSFQFHWLDFGDDFTHDSLGIRSWSFNKNCRLYEGLQFSFRRFFDGGGSLLIGNLNLGLHHLLNLPIDWLDICCHLCNTLVLSIAFGICIHEHKHHPSIHEHDHKKFHLILILYHMKCWFYIYAYACNHMWPIYEMVVRSWKHLIHI